MRITVTTSRQRARDVLAEELVRQLEDAKRTVELMSQDRERAERRENEARRALEGAERRIIQESARRVLALEQAEQHAAQLVRVICEDARRIASHSDAIERLLAALNSNEATYTCPAIDCYFVVGGTAATLADWIAKHVNWTGHDVGMIQRRQPVTVSQEALLSAAIGEPS